MLPLYNSFPHQLQASARPPQQNSMPSQPQMGMNNPQIPVPFNGVAQPGFMNGPNHLLPLQNNHLGMPHLASLGPPMPQQGNPHMNSVSAFPVRGQAVFGHNNLPNLPQFNQNVGLPFGQFCLPNPLQNMNQFVPMQMAQIPNHSQFVPHNAFGVLNQALPAAVLQNPSFNLQFGPVHHYNQNVQHNLPQPVATQQLQSNLSTNVSNSIQTEVNRKKTAGSNISSSCWNNPSSKNFTRNPKGGIMQGGFQNSQFHHVKNGKKKFGFPNANKGRGLSNEKSGKFGIANSMTQGREQRRYTAQEIQQWREERRKNYPSRGNIEKKLAENLTDKEAFEREAKTRQEQIKEILAKQAELGVEVAEIPGCYLSDPKKQGQGREENGKSLTKGKLHKKFDKRGRNNNKDRYSKKQRLKENGFSTVPFSSRKPTLLQKLLSADIKRDKNRLLQAFRFIVANTFFKDWPDKPLKFPPVIVKEGSGEDVNDMVRNMHQLAEKVDLEYSDNTVVEKIDGSDHGDDNIDDGDDDCGEDDNKNSDGSVNDEQEDEEEEGEIIN